MQHVDRVSPGPAHNPPVQKSPLMSCDGLCTCWHHHSSCPPRPHYQEAPSWLGPGTAVVLTTSATGTNNMQEAATHTCTAAHAQHAPAVQQYQQRHHVLVACNRSQPSLSLRQISTMISLPGSYHASKGTQPHNPIQLPALPRSTRCG